MAILLDAVQSDSFLSSANRVEAQTASQFFSFLFEVAKFTVYIGLEALAYDSKAEARLVK